jgi:hypothetical protein
MSPQDRKAMLEWLEGELGPLPQIVRSNLPEDAVDYFCGDEEERKMLLDRARRLLNVYEGRAASTGAAMTGRGKELRGSTEEIAVGLDPYTRRRGELFAELAELRPDVRSFRRSYLRDPLLTDEEAADFLLGRYTGRLLTTEEADAFLAERKTGRSILDGSTMARSRLGRLAGRLARYYSWRERAAARFVLTGRPPELLSVAVGFGESIRDYVPNTASIVITAEVRVSVEEVAEAYKAAQHQILGGDNRKVKDQVLEVARFVARRIREHDGKESWNEWWGEWNEKHPEKYPKGWRYSAPHGFKQAFERFVHPEYNRPKWKRRDTS